MERNGVRSDSTGTWTRLLCGCVPGEARPARIVLTRHWLHPAETGQAPSLQPLTPPELIAPIHEPYPRALRHDARDGNLQCRTSTAGVDREDRTRHPDGSRRSVFRVSSVLLQESAPGQVGLSG